MLHRPQQPTRKQVRYMTDAGAYLPKRFPTARLGPAVKKPAPSSSTSAMSSPVLKICRLEGREHELLTKLLTMKCAGYPEVFELIADRLVQPSREPGVAAGSGFILILFQMLRGARKPKRS